MKNNVLYTIYKYDTGLFISVFCENKDLPQLRCNGKCKLAKMEKEQSEEDASNMLKQLQTEALCYNEIKHFHGNYPGNPIAEVLKHTAHYNFSYSFLYTKRFVKPPASM